MGVYSIVANDASVGTTIGSFDAIDTRNGDIRLRDGTSMVVGLSYCAVRAAQTTGTAMMGKIRMTSSDLGLASGDADFVIAQHSGAGVATQSGGWGVPARYVAIDFPAKAGNIVNLAFSQMGIEPADNWSIEAGISHVAEAPPPSPWFVAAQGGGVLAKQGEASSNGGSTTTARTSLLVTNISSKYTQLISGTFLQAADPLQTTAEPSVAFVELTSTIGDFDPQEWPTSGVSPALAGTLVGLGVFADQAPLPLYFKKGATSTQAVTPFVTGLGTVTGANAYGYGIGLRY